MKKCGSALNNPPFIQQVRDACIHQMQEKLNEVFAECVAHFHWCLEDKNTLNKEDIQRYQVCMNHLKAAEQLRLNHLSEDTVNYALVQNLLKEVQLMCANFENLEFYSHSVWEILDKIKLLSSAFPE